MILKWLVLKQLHLRQIILKRQKTITGSVLLSDYETGETLAVLDGSYLTKIRTGAISGVATKYLEKMLKHYVLLVLVIKHKD